jgi:hypothetical protein
MYSKHIYCVYPKINETDRKIVLYGRIEARLHMKLLTLKK